MGAYGLPRVSHKEGVLRHLWEEDGLNISIEEVSEAERQPVPTKAGSMVMFSSMTPHGSLVNHTDTIRWSMDLRYQALGQTHRDVGMSPALSPGAAQTPHWKPPTARHGSPKLNASKRKQINTPNGHVIAGPRHHR